MNVRKNTLRAFVVATTAVLLLAACGDTGSNGSQVPNAGNDPTNPSGQDPIDTGGGRTSGIPDLSGAVALSLFDKNTYSDLINIAKNVFTPVVGDTKMVLQVTDTRNTSINGTVLFAFEDKKGWWGAKLPSVKNTGIHSGGYFDIVFSDDELTMRAVGTRTNDDLTGTLYYRVRQSTDTECKKIIQTCQDQNGNKYPVRYCGFPVTDDAYEYEPDISGACRTYMTPGATNVKGLGTFSVKYSNISILSEGN